MFYNSGIAGHFSGRVRNNKKRSKKISDKICVTEKKEKIKILKNRRKLKQVKDKWSLGINQDLTKHKEKIYNIIMKRQRDRNRTKIDCRIFFLLLTQYKEKIKLANRNKNDQTKNRKLKKEQQLNTDLVADGKAFNKMKTRK